MFLIKRKKLLLSLLCNLILLNAHATDAGDLIFHGVVGWNQDLKVVQTRAVLGYSFWNDFSMGPVFESNKYFYAPALGITWHLEPFEVLAHTGPLFWHKENVKKVSYQISVHANYMIQITTHFQFLLTAGINLPDKFFRGVPLGLGIRYWL